MMLVPFLMHERTNPLALHCLPQELLRDRDNVEDTWLVNQMVYDTVAKTHIHATVPCPKTASRQRAGRAGRTIPGINIKLVTQQEWDNLPDTEPPQPRLEDPIPIYLRSVETLFN